PARELVGIILMADWRGPGTTGSPTGEGFGNGPPKFLPRKSRAQALDSSVETGKRVPPPLSTDLSRAPARDASVETEKGSVEVGPTSVGAPGLLAVGGERPRPTPATGAIGGRERGGLAGGGSPAGRPPVAGRLVGQFGDGGLDPTD